ncbi:MAG: type II secretion system protein GspD, partial [Myxococcota bacterium]
FQKIFERKMAERKEFVDRFYGTTSEYRAAIDWDRKVGPLGSYHFRMANELEKIENNGPGQAGEQLIRPGTQPASPDDESDTGDSPGSPSTDAPASTGGGK